MRLIAGRAIDVGLRRTDNQDRLYAWSKGSLGIFLVADGMGGQNSGAIASELAVNSLLVQLDALVGRLIEHDPSLIEENNTLPPDESLSNNDESTTPLAVVTQWVDPAPHAVETEQSEHDTPRHYESADASFEEWAKTGDSHDAVLEADPWNNVAGPAGRANGTESDEATDPSFFLMDDIGKAINVTNQAILDYAREHPESVGLGSTLTMVFVIGALGIVANLGDSRIYLVRDGAISRLTSDHSLVASLAAMGYITPEEVYSHPQRNLIYRNLGGDVEAQPDITVQHLRPGDRLLVCSDGLWEMVRDEMLEAIIMDNPEPQAAAEQLVTMANENGGHDNIAAVVVAVES